MPTKKVENENGIFILERTVHLPLINTVYMGRGHHTLETKNPDMIFLEGTLPSVEGNRTLEAILNGSRTSFLVNDTYFKKVYPFLKDVDVHKTATYMVDDLGFGKYVGNLSEGITTEVSLSSFPTWFDIPIGIGLVVVGLYYNHRQHKNKKKESSSDTKTHNVAGDDLKTNNVSRRRFLRRFLGYGMVGTGTGVLAQSTLPLGILYDVGWDSNFLQSYSDRKHRMIGSSLIHRRNLIIAAKANALAEIYKIRTKKKPKVVMKYGLLHGDILNYLEHPHLLEEEVKEIITENKRNPLTNDYIVRIADKEVKLKKRNGLYYRLQIMDVNSLLERVKTRRKIQNRGRSYNRTRRNYR